LAQLPPVYLITGEKDPLSDDTIIFAGRIREAKHARKMDAIAKSTKHGQSLHMSSPGDDPILSENEDDWIHVRVIEGWSRELMLFVVLPTQSLLDGFLQMTTILPSAEEPIAMMADWICGAFDDSKRSSHNDQPVEDKEIDAEMLTIKPRARLSSFNKTATPSPTSSYFPLPSTSSKDSIAVISSGSSDEGGPSPSSLAQRAVNPPRKDSDSARRGSSGKGPAFLDASSLLQRRREEAVFGLQTPQKSPAPEEKDMAAVATHAAVLPNEYIT
jgi:hypothetical protein